MGVNFSDHPMFKAGGFSAPNRFDADIYDCEIEGKLPSDIHGVFYRLQGDYQYVPPKNDWSTGFNGDGHLSGFFFKDGRVSYKGRVIQTPRLVAEKEQRRRLYGVYRNHYTDDPSVAKLNRTAANTHVYWHGGKLLVLKEDAPAFEVDPHTLEAKGAWDFYGKYKATSMSAHPKIDPVTGEMICYGYQAKGDLSNDIAIYTVGKDGHIKHEVWFKAPFVGMIHDIAITQKHIVVPVVAMVTSDERLRSREPMWEWNLTYPTMVAILPRDGEAKDVRWFKGPARQTLHFLNAVTKGDRIDMDTPVQVGGPAAKQWRWSFDLNSKDDVFKEEVLSETNGVLARMDDRYLSLPYKYGWAGHHDDSRPYDAKRADPAFKARTTNCIQRFETGSKNLSTYFGGDVHSLQEPCFVPRKNSKGEGDGYILTVASNYAEMESELHIVDAQRMEEGAIAKVILPFRLRSGLHTNWFGGTDLPV